MHAHLTCRVKLSPLDDAWVALHLDVRRCAGLIKGLAWWWVQEATGSHAVCLRLPSLGLLPPTCKAAALTGRVLIKSALHN